METYFNYDTLTPEEKIKHLETINELLHDDIYNAWDYLTDINKLDRSPRVNLAIDVLDRVINPEDYDDECDHEYQGHETTTMNIPVHLRSLLPSTPLYVDEDFNVEIDDWMVPVIHALWDKGLMTWYSCQGHPASDYPVGYLSGPPSTSVFEVTEVLKKLGIEVTKIEFYKKGDESVDDSWAIRFPALTEPLSVSVAR